MAFITLLTRESKATLVPVWTDPWGGRSWRLSQFLDTRHLKVANVSSPSQRPW